MNPIVIVPNGIKEIILTTEEFKRYIQDAYDGGYADAKKEAFQLGIKDITAPIYPAYPTITYEKQEVTC